MNTEKYSRENLIEYLLGSLQDAETERFDELSFTDNDFADELNAAEKDLVDSYVLGGLAGVTLEKFKSHYLSSPLRREKVAFASAFQSFAESGGAEAKPSNAGFLSGLKSFMAASRMQFAAAAVLLVVILLGGLWVTNLLLKGTRDTATEGRQSPAEEQKPRSSDDVASTNAEIDLSERNESRQLDERSPVDINRNTQDGKPLVKPKAVIASFVLAPVRRGGGVPVVSLSNAITDVAFRLEMESDEYPTYRVELLDDSGSKSHWRSRTLRAVGSPENKTLNIQIPARLLESRIYSVAVTGVKPGESELVANYTFRAVLK